MSETKFHVNIDTTTTKTPFANFYSYVWRKNFRDDEYVYSKQIVDALRIEFKEECNAIIGPHSNEAYYDIKFPDDKTHTMFLLKWS